VYGLVCHELNYCFIKQFSSSRELQRPREEYKRTRFFSSAELLLLNTLGEDLVGGDKIEAMLNANNNRVHNSFDPNGLYLVIMYFLQGVLVMCIRDHRTMHIDTLIVVE
jgi:hypothetical protein